MAPQHKGERSDQNFVSTADRRTDLIEAKHWNRATVLVLQTYTHYVRLLHII